MARKQQNVGFEVALSARDDGTLEAMYVRFKEAKVARTDEVIEDVLLVDYDYKGGLIGIEILAPVKIGDLTKLVEHPRRTPFRKFITQTAPEEFVLA